MSGVEFHDAFAAALSRRRVSLGWLHDRLVERGRPVSVTALSYWRSGRSQPERGTSLDALEEVERLLHCRPGALTSLVGPSRRPGPRGPEMTHEQLLVTSPGIGPVLAGLGFERVNEELIEHVRHFAVDVDGTGRIRQMSVRSVMAARYDGARRMPVLFTLDDEGRPPEFEPLAGCSLGRRMIDADARVYGVELLLDRTLARGQEHVSELRTVLPEPVADTRFDHVATRRMRELMVWVRFDPALVPAQVRRYTSDGDGAEAAEPVELGDGTSAHVAVRGFGPGVVGLRWEW